MGKSQHWRNAIVVTACFALVGASISVYLYQERLYATPTPVPTDYESVSPGARIELAALHVSTTGRPVHLHFFNPTCPCSRFGLDHFRGLYRRFGKQVDFIVVLPGDEPAALSVYNGFHLGIPAIVDTGGRIASATGAFSTPQAAIIDTRGRLYFRGNYNSSRYCTSVHSEYARLALTALLAGASLPNFPPAASTAYGCPLPKRRRGASDDVSDPKVL